MPTEPDATTRVLLVHDDPTLTRALARVLRSAGFDVVTAASRDDAVQALATRTIAAVVLDLATPDGASLLAHARELHDGVGRVVLADVPRGGEQWVERPVESNALRTAVLRVLE